MPLAKYITQFLELDRKAQASAVIKGKYNNSQLKSLKKHATNDVVLETIDTMLGHGEMDFEKPTEFPAPVSKGHSVAISTQLNQAAHLLNHRYEILTNPKRAASRAVIEIGIIMLGVKEQLPHGQLGIWREQNTQISRSWDKYCRKAAEKFIAEHGQGTAAALIEGTICNERQIEHAEQLLMEFTGGKGPSALLHDLGIKKKPQPPEPPQLPPNETTEHLDAKNTWEDIAEAVGTWGLKEQTWAHLNRDEREGLYQIVHELDNRLKASLKGGD